eukprot:Phypoly_transcript_05072.p1 GENE.Phypoly_transcript_05072~~Phypoly_transcript_05072.p1  ORF type:complete len:674 (+),score=184.28 Phypoly_transcript_05072:260-2023(+)
MRENQEDDEGYLNGKSKSNGKSSEISQKTPKKGKPADGEAAKKGKAENGKSTKKEGREEKEGGEGRDEAFKEFLPSAKKRKVDPKDSSFLSPPPTTPSKVTIGTPILRQQTPSKNSPFYAYKPNVPSIGVLENGFHLNSPTTPSKRSATTTTPRKPAPLTPIAKKALSEQLETYRNTTATTIAKSSFPLDFVLKTNAVFTSHTSFEWCKAVGPNEQLQGMASLFSPAVSSSTATPTSDVAKYFAATCIFMFPGNNLPFEGEHFGELHKQLIRTNWLRDRWKEWEQSFSNLYHTFTAGHTQYFYMMHHQFSVLFSAVPNPEKPKSSPVRVLIGKSTRSLRMMLHKAEIPFSMPYHKGELDYLAPGEDSEAMLELKEMQKTLSWQNSPATTKGIVSIPASDTLLLIEGKKDVEKIFRFLLTYQTKLEEEEERKEKERLEKNKGTPGKKNIKLLGGKFKPEPAAPPTRKMLRDVPVLYSNTPFLNATFKQVTTKSNDTMTRAASTPGSKLENVNKLELEGPILPANMRALCDLFARTQKGNFGVALKHDETTEGMNTGMGQGLGGSAWVKKAVCGEEGRGSPFMLYTETQ